MASPGASHPARRAISAKLWARWRISLASCSRNGRERRLSVRSTPTWPLSSSSTSWATARSVKAIRQFVYNLNVPARWGQSPFTNVTLDITVPDDLESQTPICGGDHLFAGHQNGELLRIAQPAPPRDQTTDGHDLRRLRSRRWSASFSPITKS